MKVKNSLTFGLVGIGYYGPIIAKALKSLGNLIWQLNSKSDYTSFDLPDWVFIVTPNVVHYEQAKYFLNNGTNVCIAKHTALNSQALEHLIDIANNKKCLLYISDVFLFDKRLPNNPDIENPNFFLWQKSDSNQKDSLFDRLTYHHLYLISEKINNTNPKFVINEIKKVSNLEFDLNLNIENSQYNLSYKIGKHQRSKHIIFGNDITKKNSESLFLMIQSMLQDEADFKKNQARSLWVLKSIEKLKKSFYKKIGVVGGGIFGCTAAIELSKRGHDVTLYEQHDDIFLEASSINQYRIHRGYHYPRSKQTAISCKKTSLEFIKSFRQAIVLKNPEIEHYYAIAKNNSLTSPSQYIEFLECLGLEYDIVQNIPNTSLTVKVQEYIFNPIILKEIIKNRLKGSNVNVKIGVQASRQDLNNYDASVIATYSKQNNFITNSQLYQFELCEKPIMRLPKKYHNKSIVIMDGPFMCIDPYANSDNHVMGNVVHAIHSNNIGKSPFIPDGFNKLLNKGIIRNPEITNVSKFIESAKHFFPDIEKAKHVGSMFTFRVVKPNMEHSDARPTLVDLIEPNMVSVFSGKICTSLDAAKKVANLLEIEPIL